MKHKKRNVAQHQNLIIEGLIASLDFYRVSKTMEALDWTWGKDTVPPSISVLREYARTLLFEMFQENLTMKY